MLESSGNNKLSDIKPSTDFIAGLTSELRAEEEADNDLVDILESYILKENPPENAVAQALEKIKKLAETRAKETNDVK